MNPVTAALHAEGMKIDPVAEEANHPLEFAKRQYRLALAGHDWTYSMSDDYSAYKRGQDERRKLLAMRSKLDQDGAIWREYNSEGY